MEQTLRALAEPKRRRILQLVESRELTAGEIARRFDISRPAVSQHLGVLKEAGLLDERREGTKRLYRTRAQGLEDLRSFLDSFWGARLDQLKAVAEEESSTKRRSARRKSS